MNEVWSFMYSPADRPSRTRAAEAKNRSWSADGGSSSDRVSPTGFPVFLVSAAMISSARASTASANRNIARLRSDGVASRHDSNAVAAACSASSTSAVDDTGACAYASPVLGSTTSLYLPSRGSVYLPFTKLRSGPCDIPASSIPAWRALTLTPTLHTAMPRWYRQLHLRASQTWSIVTSDSVVDCPFCYEIS